MKIIKKYHILQLFCILLCLLITSCGSSSTDSSVAESTYNLNVIFYGNQLNTSGDTIRGYLKITNNGDTEIPLTTMSLHYYYTAKDSISDAPEQKMVIDYAGIISPGTANTDLDTTSSFSNTFTEMSPPTTTADTYARIRPTSAHNLQPTETLQLDYRIHADSFSQTYDFQNDYSNGDQNDYVEWEKIPVYINNILVHGTEPN
ncbi:hypothetical protein DID76_04470 [Candidatus Marinamargulisbacteria bacterium SCGC AG-414-C22]|nr:hypothetical protein DID76_04470 [Candidatus Marinamargulisbacteria bacterium SCGC AG-414-C22]